MKKIILTVLVVTTLFACKTNSETKKDFDLVNAKKEIETANTVLSEAIEKGDTVAIGNAYTTDAKLMYADAPAVLGRANIQKDWSGTINSGGNKLKMTTLEVWGDENILTEEGVYDFKSKEDKPIAVGKYLVIWKKEDGKWKLYRDMANSDVSRAKI